MCSEVRARVHAGELVRNRYYLEHASKVIKHASFNRVHAKKAIHSQFGAHEHQVGIELYYICT